MEKRLGPRLGLFAWSSASASFGGYVVDGFNGAVRHALAPSTPHWPGRPGLRRLV